MTAYHASIAHTPATPPVFGRLAELPQATKEAKSTVVQDGDHVVRIITDQHGNTRIERTGPSDGAAVAPATPPVPPLPGMLVPSRASDNDIPPQAVEMVYALCAMFAVIVVGWPIARAFGRRIERKAVAAELSPAAADQLRRIEQGVEAMAIEVERISESQRFMARLQSGSTAERA